ncbi:hypothetical protein DL96DRAFT_1817375 [Flagelloscypha sp. PMI_526]|nr:hypothetical protein DL96DRAFT_1817375 [Flagelloscypha sp. PMI_526]
MSRQIGKFRWTPDHLNLKNLCLFVRGQRRSKPLVFQVTGRPLPPNLKALSDDLLEPDEKVLCHVHGGSFIYCFAHLSYTTAGILRSLLQLHTRHIACSFSVEYRLASTKTFHVFHPIPTALIDCLSGYHCLVHDVGCREENIIVVGDSADYDIYGPSPSWPQTAYLQPHGYGIADFNEYIPPASLLLGVRSKAVGSC